MANETAPAERLTLLHGNDLHGQLIFKADEDMVLHGGISMMADYIKRVRSGGERVFLSFSGDILEKNIQGADFKGINTVELINNIRPDAISLGNHEMDYGLAHLLIFKECIEAPVLNANIMVAPMKRHLFRASLVRDLQGVRLLVIGLFPRSFFDKIESDAFCRDMLSYKDSYEAIREESRRHEDENIDLVVLMTHYGLEGDRTLAMEMPPDCRVDLILGGHSHIDMEAPEVVNDIVIAQSSYGTTHIGRFDLEVNTVTHRLISWRWERVAITNETCGFDEAMESLADRVLYARRQVPEGRLGEFAAPCHHESRLLETELGDIVADAFQELYGVDLVLLQSGSIRRKECSGTLTEAKLKELFPYDDVFIEAGFSGKELREMFAWLFARKPDGSLVSGEFQYSRGFELVVDFSACRSQGGRVVCLRLRGEEIDDNRTYRLGFTRNCAENFYRYFSRRIDPDMTQVLSLSTYNDLARWFLMRPGPVVAPPKGRFTALHFEELGIGS
ncbi:MAG: bifunctional metallophosphatase/5'-nucleotidase [Schwartzia sp.]|nr:bifunctional metallophosphatase/5'-nucleotidase [Schwartzia sp. (in: firmicutes)]